MDPIADAMMETQQFRLGEGLTFAEVVDGMHADRFASFRRDVWKEGWSISASGFKRYERDDSYPIYISSGEVHLPWNPCLDDLMADDWRLV